MAAITNKKTDVLGPAPGNGAAALIGMTVPYIVEFTLQGVCAMLFHRWDDESIRVKGEGPKGSDLKKTDDVQSYVYRTEKNEIALPGVYVYGSMCDKKNGAAKYRQDPRSKRASAVKLFQAGISPLTELASLGTDDWDFLDRRRAVVQLAGITRTRPAFHAGWQATFQFVVNLPEYISPAFFLDVLTLAGRVVGVADFRPTYGRFDVVRFEVVQL
jgi:hypothetical protein